MSPFTNNSDLHAYLSQLILPTHLRDDGGEITQTILSGYNTPGISVAILPPSSDAEEYAKKPILTTTFGLRDCTDNGSFIDAETTFQAASISKPFAAMAVLRLVVQGKLNLDVDIEEYLAFDKNHSVVRDELHCSAIVNPATAPRTPITLRLLLSHNTAHRRYHKRRLGTSYSGGGTTVVQHILTLVTGKPFPSLMRELVLGPLGMTRSTYEQPVNGGQAGRVNYAKAHHTAYTGYTGGTECMIYPEMAAAGLWTTPSDLLKGLRAVFDCLSGAEGAFLPPALVADSFTETNGFGGFGVGWQSETLSTNESSGRRRVILGHGGINQGFTCNLSLVGDLPLAGREPPVSNPKPPCDIAWMSNSDHGPQLGGRIVTAFGWLVGEPLKLIYSPVVAHLFFPVLATTPAEHEKVAKQIEGWQAWSGRWQMKEGGDVALYGPRVALNIAESGALPTMTLSVLSDTTKPLVLLPAAFNPPDSIVWVVRDMNVVVIWQNGMAYAAEKI
ncbi:beta-lactamase/transpeptidase-like protein [Mycena latifolia]|nr:beta-lactamase/transpeptidase-like protein [Mycena latifolia]